MDEKNVNKENLEPQVEEEELVEEPQPDTQPEAPKADQPETGAPKADDQLAQAQEKYLRLAAEYDNYRKRTAKEKESAWTNAKAEMTMKGLQDALAGLGVEVIPALGETFDPNRHNAVMHVEDDAAGENTVVEVFQQGFTCGDKVIRFAMVKVAN